MVGLHLLSLLKNVMKKNLRELRKERVTFQLTNLMNHILILLRVANGLPKVKMRCQLINMMRNTSTQVKVLNGIQRKKMRCQLISLMNPILIQDKVLSGHQKEIEVHHITQKFMKSETSSKKYHDVGT